MARKKKTSEDNSALAEAAMILITSGFTPEQYKELYDSITRIAGDLSFIFPGVPEESDDSSADLDNFSGDIKRGRSYPLARMFGKKPTSPEAENNPMKNAEEKTLSLKIQMKGVIKPPMWREVEIPSNFDFLQLHKVIQTVTGLTDSHLWHFLPEPSDHSLTIGIPDDDDFSFGFSETLDAGLTPVTPYLGKKGDKIEYTYDFGDDWTFTVMVKGIIDKKCERPVCTHYKGELNPVEDSGGVWGYLDMRADLEQWDSLKPKERKERAERHFYDSAGEYIEMLRCHCIDLKNVNKYL